MSSGELKAVIAEVAHAFNVKSSDIRVFGSARFFSGRPSGSDIDLYVIELKHWPSNSQLKKLGVTLSKTPKSNIGTLTRVEKGLDGHHHHAVIAQFHNADVSLEDVRNLGFPKLRWAAEGSQGWVPTGNHNEFQWSFSLGTQLWQAKALVEETFFLGEEQDLSLGNCVKSSLGRKALFPWWVSPSPKKGSCNDPMNNVKVSFWFHWYPLSRLTSPTLPSVDITTMDSGLKLSDRVEEVFDRYEGARESYRMIRDARGALLIHRLALRSAALQCGLLAFVNGYGNPNELKRLAPDKFTRKFLAFWCGIDWAHQNIARDLNLTEKLLPGEVLIFDPFGPESRFMPHITTVSMKLHNELLCRRLGLPELIPSVASICATPTRCHRAILTLNLKAPLDKAQLANLMSECENLTKVWFKKEVMFGLHDYHSLQTTTVAHKLLPTETVVQMNPSPGDVTGGQSAASWKWDDQLRGVPRVWVFLRADPARGELVLDAKNVLSVHPVGTCSTSALKIGTEGIVLEVLGMDSAGVAGCVQALTALPVLQGSVTNQVAQGIID
jgi:hypothetical protein